MYTKNIINCTINKSWYTPFSPFLAQRKKINVLLSIRMNGNFPKYLSSNNYIEDVHTRNPTIKVRLGMKNKLRLEEYI